MKILTPLEKLPEEHRVFAFDFGAQKEITEGAQTIASATIAKDPTGTLAIASIAIVGAKVKANYSGGVAGESYQLECEATLSSGAIIGMIGPLIIVDPDELIPDE